MLHSSSIELVFLFFQHLPTSVHREFVDNSANYLALDNLISQLPSLKNLNMENGLDDWQFKMSRLEKSNNHNCLYILILNLIFSYYYTFYHMME